METNYDIRAFRHDLRRLERFLAVNLKSNSVCCGVTFNECHILLRVEEAGDITISDIVDYLGVDKSVVSRTVDALVKKNWLLRNESLHDRRTSTVSLSDEGRAFLHGLNSQCDEFYMPVLEKIAPDKLNTVIKAVTTLCDAFESAEISRSCKCLK